MFAEDSLILMCSVQPLTCRILETIGQRHIHWLTKWTGLQLSHKSDDRCAQNKITIHFCLPLGNHGHRTVYFLYSANLCSLPTEQAEVEGLRWYPGWWAMSSKPQAWTEPVSREGGKSSPKYSCDLYADQVFVIRKRIPSGFPLAGWWAWEQTQYQESDYEIIIHCSLLGRKFRAVSLHGTMEGGSVQERGLCGSLSICTSLKG